MDLKTIGERISFLRGNEALEVFGKRYGASKQQIYAYEKNKSKPASDFYESIQKISGVNLNWLICGIEPVYIKGQKNDEHEKLELYYRNKFITELTSSTGAKVIKNGHRKKNPYQTLNSNGIINYSLN